MTSGNSGFNSSFLVFIDCLGHLRDDSMKLPKIWDELWEFWVPINFHQVFSCLSPIRKLTKLLISLKGGAKVSKHKIFFDGNDEGTSLFTYGIYLLCDTN